MHPNSLGKLGQDTTVSNASVSLHIPFLDVLRGVAAIAVVLHHAAVVVGVKAPHVMGTFPYSVTHYGVFGVEVFFVVSGFCIAAAAANIQERGKGIRAFALARWRRIYPPYWASLLVYTCMAFALLFLAQRGIIGPTDASEAAADGRFNLQNIATNITLTQLLFGGRILNIVAWTLCYEVAFYVIYGIGLALIPRNTSALLRLLHAFTAIVLMAQIVFPGRIPYPFDMWAMFGLGIAAFHWLRAERVEPDGRQEASRIMGVLCALTIGVMLRGMHTHVSTMSHPTTLAFGVALGTLLVLFLVRNISQKAIQNSAWRPLAAVGIFSYSLYLIHFTCLGIANQALNLLKIPPAMHLVQLFLSVALAILGGYIFYLLFEKPLTKKPGNVNARQTPAVSADPGLQLSADKPI